jgi:hypothetical protein
MTLTFIEAPAFTRDRETHFNNDESYQAFQTMLLENAEAGDVIMGTGGIRKVRWNDARRGKGKRGGLRVLYLLIKEAQTVLLLVVFDKDKKDDLTTSQRRVLAGLSELYRQEILGESKS